MEALGNMVSNPLRKGTVVGTLIMAAGFLCIANCNESKDRLPLGSGPQERYMRLRRRLIPGAVPFPDYVEHGLSNVWEPFNKTTETAVFWKLLRSGSTSLQPYLSDCLNLVMASEVGIMGHVNDKMLEVEELESERRYINVDATTATGLVRAKEMGLVESGLVDVIATPLFKESAGLFNDEHKGRYFTILRHPVERVASLFYYLQKDSSQGSHPDFKNMTLETYAKSEYVESNFMVRNLIDKKTEALTPSDLELAKKILQRKFLIGLARDMSGSLDRIHIYFGWPAVDHYRRGVFQRAEGCKTQYLSDSHVSHNHVDHQNLVEGTDAWNLLHKANWADVALYEYAEALYLEQQGMFRAMNDE